MQKIPSCLSPNLHVITPTICRQIPKFKSRGKFSTGIYGEKMLHFTTQCSKGQQISKCSNNQHNPRASRVGRLLVFLRTRAVPAAIVGFDEHRVLDMCSILYRDIRFDLTAGVIFYFIYIFPLWDRRFRRNSSLHAHICVGVLLCLPSPVLHCRYKGEEGSVYCCC